MRGLFRAEESRRAGRAAQTLLSASGAGAGYDGAEVQDVESFADVLQRISRSLNTQTAPHRGTPPPTRNIPSATATRPSMHPFSSSTNAALPAFLQAPVIPANAGSAPLDDGSGSSYPAPSSFEGWPFPSVNDTTDALSMQFFAQAGLSGVGAPPSANDYWGAGLGDGGLPPLGGVGGMGGEYGTLPGMEGLGTSWGDGVGGIGTSGEANQLSSLLDQLGGGW